MRTCLEIYSGTASFGTIAKEEFGYDLFTIDYTPEFNPSLCQNMLLVEKDDLPKRFQTPTIIWASPPCNKFSTGTFHCHNFKNFLTGYAPIKPEAEEALAFVAKAIVLIDQLKPRFWFIENPRGLLKKMPFMEELNYFLNEVCYCQYGDKRMKPTDIWTNLVWESKPMCYNGCPDHETAHRGDATGTQGLSLADRGRIPINLCREILETIEEYNSSVIEFSYI